MKLLINFKPFKDESFFGYILRLSNSNQCSNIIWIYNLNGIPMSGTFFKPELVNLGSLAKMIGISENELWALTPHHFLRDTNNENVGYDQYILRYGINNHSIKICPICLTNKLYYRSSWDININVSCAKHKCLLVNRCPNCNSKILQFRRNLLACDCGYDLRNIQVNKIPKEELTLTIY